MADENRTPTELDILNSYLLPPSSLPTIIPLPTFTALLQSQHRSHPHIRALYRDLQFQRSVDIDTVRANVERESSRGVGMRARLQRNVQAEMREGEGVDDGSGSRKRRRTSEGLTSMRDSMNPNGDTDTDVLLDTALLLSGDPNNLGMVPRHGASAQHTLPSLLSAMEEACREVEKEGDQAEAAAEKMLAEMRETIGALSDLRYGKFARVSGADADGDGALEKEVTLGLRGLVGVCD